MQTPRTEKTTDDDVYSLRAVYYMDSVEGIKAYLDRRLEYLGAYRTDETAARWLISTLRAAKVAKGLLQLATDTGIDKDTLHELFALRQIPDQENAIRSIAAALGMESPDADAIEEHALIDDLEAKMHTLATRRIAADTGIDRNDLIGMLGSFRIPKHIPDIVPKVIASLTAPVRSKTSE
jgi:DNA-binding phage protein